ncbi:MAG UNVERIFIED_CONTAM: hypothetical protein LVT10_08850 [Anaerolineae bacterium]|jgi:hypothetical protein
MMWWLPIPSGMLRKAHEVAKHYKVLDKIVFEHTDFLNLPSGVEGTF